KRRAMMIARPGCQFPAINGEHPGYARERPLTGRQPKRADRAGTLMVVLSVGGVRMPACGEPQADERPGNGSVRAVAGPSRRIAASLFRGMKEESRMRFNRLVSGGMMAAAIVAGAASFAQPALALDE